MKIKPLGDRILVQREEAEEKTESGLYLPDSAKEKQQRAKVVAVGEGKVNEKTGKRHELPVKKGDTVLLSKWGGTEVTIGEEDYLIANIDDVMAVVE
jgi:chaperonin GroES